MATAEQAGTLTSEQHERLRHALRPRLTKYNSAESLSLKQQAGLLLPHNEALFGGAAGGGKSSWLLQAAAQYVDVPGYSAVLLRRSYKQLEEAGAIMDRSKMWWSNSDAEWSESTHRWLFPSGAKIAFRYLEGANDWMNFQGPEFQFVGFDELTQFCHRPGTEVLTEDGWKRIESVVVGDEVLALTPDWQARYEKVDKTYAALYDGDLIETANRSVRFSVTSNHRMVIEGQRNGDWRFCDAGDLPAFPMYPFGHQWDGAEIAQMRLPLPSGRGIGPNANVAETVDGDVYLRLLGWWMAEGSCFYTRQRQASPVVSIRQTRPSPELHELVQDLPWRSSVDGAGGYRIFSKQLHDHLTALGTTYTKRVPRWVMGLSRRQLGLFFEAFASGDGHRVANGAVAFGLANEGLVDDLQEIAAKLGRRATKGHSTVRGFDVWRLYVHARSGGKIQDKPHNIRRVPYRGSVYCIRVNPSHTFLCRYEGRMFWSGNTEKQYTYLFSRLRKPKPPEQWPKDQWRNLSPKRKRMIEALSKVPLRMRAATNPGGPGADWVKQRFGLYVPDGDEDRRRLCERPEWVAEHGRVFLPAKVKDNPGLDIEGYIQQLQHLDPTTRAQYLDGDWEAKEPGEFFRRDWFQILDTQPTIKRAVRYWDLAATEPSERNHDPDYTVGVKLGQTEVGWVVLDVQRGRWRSERVEQRVAMTAEMDGAAVMIGMEQEPGSAGKALIRHYQQNVLRRYGFRGYPPADSKAVRARPVAAKCEAGMVSLLRGQWIQSFLDELEIFPPDKDGGHDDQVDSLSGAFHMLVGRPRWHPL